MGGPSTKAAHGARTGGRQQPQYRIMRVLSHSAAFCVTRVVDARPRLHPPARDLTPLKTTPCRRGAALANGSWLPNPRECSTCSKGKPRVTAGRKADGSGTAPEGRVAERYGWTSKAALARLHP